MTRLRCTEGSSSVLLFQVVDSDGAAVNLEDLTVATLTLYDLDTRTIINGRDAQDILASGLSPESLNDVTYEANGYVRWDLQGRRDDASPADAGDNPIVNSRRQIERHQPIFHFEFPSGVFTYGIGDVEIEVRALDATVA